MKKSSPDISCLSIPLNWYIRFCISLGFLKFGDYLYCPRSPCYLEWAHLLCIFPLLLPKVFSLEPSASPRPVWELHRETWPIRHVRGWPTLKANLVTRVQCSLQSSVLCYPCYPKSSQGKSRTCLTRVSSQWLHFQQRKFVSEPAASTGLRTYLKNRPILLSSLILPLTAFSLGLRNISFLL